MDEKAQKESEALQAQRDAAGDAWEKMYRERQEMIANTKASNREAEEQFVSDRDKALTSGETWERVAFFCDFQLSGEGRDTSRMRELLIQLKH